MCVRAYVFVYMWACVHVHARMCEYVCVDVWLFVLVYISVDICQGMRICVFCVCVMWEKKCMPVIITIIT